MADDKKRCGGRCGRPKSITQFPVLRSGYRAPVCEQCMDEQALLVYKYEKLMQAGPEADRKKVCPSCGDVFKRRDFGGHIGKRGGYCPTCRPVRSSVRGLVQRALLVAGPPEGLKLKRGEAYCWKCEEVKNEKQFYPLVDGPSRFCRPCTRTLTISDERRGKMPEENASYLIGAVFARALAKASGEEEENAA